MQRDERDPPEENDAPASPRRPVLDLKATELNSEPAPAADMPAHGDTTTAHGPDAAARALPPPPPPRLGAAALTGALAAALVVAGMGAGAWWYGLRPSLQQPAAGAAIEARLRAAEARLQDLAQRPAAVAAPPLTGEAANRLSAIEQTLAGLDAKLAQIESRPAAPSGPPAADPALLERVTASETAAKAVEQNLAALRASLDEAAALAREARIRADAAAAEAQKAAAAAPAAAAASRGAIDALSGRLAAVEQSVKELGERLTRVQASGADPVARKALAAALLRSAVERGTPFAAELASVRALFGNPPALAALDQPAASGIESSDALARELTAVLPAMRRLADEAASPDASFMARLQTNAARLVRIRPAGDAPGDDPRAVLSRIDARAARADVDGALAELAKLPPNLRAPAEPWMRKAEARRNAIALARQIADEANAALIAPAR